MPLYCYEHKGEIADRAFPVGEAPRFVTIGGKTFKRSFQSERVSGPLLKGWPLECLGSGVNANQAGELRSFLERSGVPTEVSRDGNPIYRNAKHRRKALKVRGLVDRKSYL